jgi:SAM-dependent methyltransferase
VLRAIRPYSAHQEDVDEALLARLDMLDARLEELAQLPRADPDEIDKRFDAYDRMRAEIIHALESVRGRVEPLDGLQDAIRIGAEAVLAIPYMEGHPFSELDVPHAGRVVGFRGHESPAESDYLAFEEIFRGSEDRVRASQEPYVDLLRDRAPVLDVGCGRGELLDLLRDADVEYRGVDVDGGMVARCRSKGHESVVEANAIEYLESLPECSLGAVFSAQLIEHLPEDDLRRLIELARSRLRPGGLFVAETVNPHCPRALKAFWLDLTHQHPIFPEVALMLCRIADFAEAYIYYPLGAGLPERDRFAQDAYAVVATVP